MWSTIFKTLLEALKVVGTKAATKVASTGTGSIAQQLVNKVGNVGSKGAGEAVSKVVSTVDNGNGERRAGDVIGAVLGNPLKNLSNKIEKPSLKPYLSKTDNSETGSKDSSLITNAVKQSGGEVAGKVLGAVGELFGSKGGKVAKIASKVLGGESFGSKMFLNTLSNMAQQGAFSGSGVGQPDKNFGGMLANSAVGALTQSAGQRRQESYKQEQDLMNMAQDFDPALLASQKAQPVLLTQINDFQTKIVDTAANRRKNGGWLKSADMVDFQNEYINIKNNINKFNTGAKVLQSEWQQMNKEPGNWEWDKEGAKYFNDSLQMPAMGTFLIPAKKDPRVYFPTLKVSGYVQESADKPYNMVSRMNNEQKQLYAVSELLSNPGVARYAESAGYNKDDPKDQARFGVDFGQYIEPSSTDFQKQQAYEDRQQAKSDRLSDKQEKETGALGYAVSGDRVVFTKDKTENILKSTLSDASGTSISGSGDEAIPVKFESIGSDGSLIVTATIKDMAAPDQSVMKQFHIAPNKSKTLTEAFYPGAYDAATKLYVPPKEPVGFLKGDQKSSVSLPKGEVRRKDPKTGKVAVFNGVTEEFIRWE